MEDTGPWRTIWRRLKKACRRIGGNPVHRPCGQRERWGLSSRRSDQTASEFDEVTVLLPTQEKICSLAERIEQAYMRRYPDWSPLRTTSGVWNATAAGLLMLHRNTPAIPVDPELFVAVQPHRHLGGPWADLAQRSSLRRYRRHIRLIVTQLPERDQGRGPPGRKTGPARSLTHEGARRLEWSAVSPRSLYHRPPRRPRQPCRAIPRCGRAAASFLAPCTNRRAVHSCQATPIPSRDPPVSCRTLSFLRASNCPASA